MLLALRSHERLNDVGHGIDARGRAHSDGSSRLDASVHKTKDPRTQRNGSTLDHLIEDFCFAKVKLLHEAGSRILCLIPSRPPNLVPVMSHTLLPTTNLEQFTIHL